MHRVSLNARFTSLAALTLCAAFVAEARLSADSLAGRIQDPQGLAVPNASVRLLDRTSGNERTTVSATDGSYSFPDLPGGTYVIEADAADSALIGSQEIAVRGEQTVN